VEQKREGLRAKGGERGKGSGWEKGRSDKVGKRRKCNGGKKRVGLEVVEMGARGGEG